MSSYFSSYFNSSNQATNQAYPQNPGGTSTWSKTLSSRLQTLRKALTTDSEQDDPDDEDCSHVSNVLRGYYTETGRPFPPWLPPDPKKPSIALPPPQNQYSQVGNAYGGFGGNQYGNGQQPGGRNQGGRGGGLSDLWDSGPAQAAAAPVPQSLRAPRPERPIPQSILQSHGSAGSSGSFSQANSQSSQSSQNTTRPLPSQRAGSYQSAQSSMGSGAGAGSRDRLRARLQAGGSGRNSPVSNVGTSAHNASRNNTHTNSSYSSQGSSGGSPYVSASQPWVGGDDYYGGYAEDAGQQSSTSRPSAPGLGRSGRPGGPR